jgi:hypothetical protein
MTRDPLNMTLNIMMMTKSKSVRWVGHVACMHGKGRTTEDLGIDDRY